MKANVYMEVASRVGQKRVKQERKRTLKSVESLLLYFLLFYRSGPLGVKTISNRTSINSRRTLVIICKF
jgi:hypothetical protein